MRKIAELPEATGLIFERYLRSRQVEVTLRPTVENNDTVELWVIDDEHQQQVKDELTIFIANPDDPKYRAVTRTVPIKPRRNRYIDVRTQVFHNRAGGRATLTLIVINVLVFVLQQFPNSSWFIEKFYFSRYISPTFVEISDGQLWRLLTPIFLHFGIWHILFNMLWLYSLGNQLEQRDSSRYLLVFVVVSGILSNLAQYLIDGPGFGGFSGVVYGLLGYVWMQVRFNPRRGYTIDNFTIIFMVCWLILGIVGMLGNVANSAHVFGLVTGLVWGLIVTGQLGKFLRGGRR